jgi:hypothetical protein
VERTLGQTKFKFFNTQRVSCPEMAVNIARIASGRPVVDAGGRHDHVPAYGTAW